jgi:tRNA (guanine37-N1)-methyltransferase
MNLPDSAIEFLDVFRGILSFPELNNFYDVMPMIHCHCFTREVTDPEKAEQDIRVVRKTLHLHSKTNIYCRESRNE